MICGYCTETCSCLTVLSLSTSGGQHVSLVAMNNQRCLFTDSLTGEHDTVLLLTESKTIL